MYMKKCDNCGTKYTTPQVTGRYCCNACKREAERRRSKGEVLPFNEPVQFGPTSKELASERKKKHNQYLAPQLEKLSIRKCHDCPKQTTNYRCPSCLRKWRIKYGVRLEYSGGSL